MKLLIAYFLLMLLNCFLAGLLLGMKDYIHSLFCVFFMGVAGIGFVVNLADAVLEARRKAAG